MSNAITAVITSFNRFHLLDKCINSLLHQDISLLEKIIIGEDSGDISMKNKIDNLISQYPNHKIELQFNNPPLTQPGNIDQLYGAVQTPYILHIEDDYVFNGNPNFIQNSIDILEERKNINYVWIRCLDNYNESHNLHDGRILFGGLKKSNSGVDYREFTYQLINFSWMPHISRLQDYKNAFPNGYKSLILKGERSSLAEMTCGLMVRNSDENPFKYKSCTLENGACRTYNHFTNSTYR